MVITTDTFVVQVKDSSSTPKTATATITLSIYPDPLVITTVSLPNGVDGVLFSDQLASTGGTGTVTWALASGSSLVAGLKLSASGLVSGIATASTNGAGNFTVIATDSAKPAHTATATIPYLMNPENGNFRVSTTQFQNATQGIPYTSSIQSSGGVGAVTFKLINGTALPAGLNLAATGAITGTPSAVPTNGFMVQATDSSTPTPKTVIAWLNILVIASNLTVSPHTLAGATVGKPFNTTFTAGGGKSPYAWSIVGANAFDGLSLSPAGALSGTPIAPTAGALNSSFEVEVTDSSSPQKAGYALIHITIAPAPLMVQTTQAPMATVGVSYSANLMAIGGINPFTWAIASGSAAPGGLALSPAGVLSGTPTTASGNGPTTFVVQVEDSEKPPMIATGTVSIVIAPPANSLIINPSLPPAYVGTAYSSQISVNGGAGPYTWMLAGASTPPAGLKLTTGGEVEGTPTTKDSSFTFNVKVTDSSSPKRTGTATISLPVYGPVAECTPPLTPSLALQERLKGTYSFHGEQVPLNPGGVGNWILGAFTADGTGNLKGGIFDANGPSASTITQGTFTGTYLVGPDDRGIMTISILPTSGEPFNKTNCFALDSFTSGVAGAGQMVEDDGDDTVTHSRFFAQGGAGFTESSVKGSWAFGMQGAKIDSNDNEVRATIAGYLKLDGAGNITGGEADFSTDSSESSGGLQNTYSSQVPITGAYTLASTGRGTMSFTFTLNGQKHTGSFVFYVAGPNQLLLLNSQPGLDPSNSEDNNAVLVGRAFLRTTSTFNDATLNGASVYISQGLSDTGPSIGRKIQAGILNWDGKGGVKGSADKNDGGTVTLAPDNAFSADYAVDAEGRVTLTNAGNHPPIFYLAGPNQGFGVDASSSVNFNQIENQTVPAGGFTADSYSGGYSVGSLWYGFMQETAFSGEETSEDATETVNGTEDTNTQGMIAVDQTFSFTYAPAATGRFLKYKGSDAIGAIYLVSPTKAYTIDISGKPWSTLIEANHQ
jgi:hypothetical protein